MNFDEDEKVVRTTYSSNSDISKEFILKEVAKNLFKNKNIVLLIKILQYESNNCSKVY